MPCKKSNAGERNPKITNCPHVTRSHEARGRCKTCYNRECLSDSVRASYRRYNKKRRQRTTASAHTHLPSNTLQNSVPTGESRQRENSHSQASSDTQSPTLPPLYSFVPHPTVSRMAASLAVSAAAAAAGASPPSSPVLPYAYYPGTITSSYAVSPAYYTERPSSSVQSPLLPSLARSTALTAGDPSPPLIAYSPPPPLYTVTTDVRHSLKTKNVVGPSPPLVASGGVTSSSTLSPAAPKRLPSISSLLRTESAPTLRSVVGPKSALTVPLADPKSALTVPLADPKTTQQRCESGLQTLALLTATM